MTDLMGSKLRRKKMAQSLQSFQEDAAAPTSKFALRQLEKMGWKQGEGLGKNRNGRTTHIKVKKREEEQGLGVTENSKQDKMDSEWWKHSLGDAYAKLGGKKKRKKVFTDEELFEATGGARFGMRAAPTKNLAKWRRTGDTLEMSQDKDKHSETENQDETLPACNKKRKKLKSEKKSKKQKKEKREKKKRKETMH